MSYGSYTRFGRPPPKNLQGLQFYKRLLVSEMRLPTSTAPLFAEPAKSLPAHGIICLSARPIPSRAGEGNDLHHHREPVLDSPRLATPTSSAGKRFPFLWAAQPRRRTWPQQTKLRISPGKT